ncbi:MAG: metallopeptidase family protein [bacterium]|nr:metallopeptidase family protein [bacterium]
MTRDDFEKLVGLTMDDLPDHIRAKMSNVAVVVEDTPSDRQLKKGGTRQGMLLLGLYEGVPQTKRGVLGYNFVLPDKITIFQNSIEQVARSEKEIESVIKETVWHEFAHHFGHDETAVRKLSSKRKKS